MNPLTDTEDLVEELSQIEWKYKTIQVMVGEKKNLQATCHLENIYNKNNKKFGIP